MPSRRFQRLLSPLIILAITIASIFLAEVIAMFAVYWLRPASYWLTTLVDGTIMVLLIFPVLYVGLFRRLVHILQAQRHTEKALRHSIEIFEQIFSVTHVMFAYLDADFNFVRVNPAYARAGGHPPEYYVGKNHFDLYPHPENQAIFQHVVASGEVYAVDEKPFAYADQPELGTTYWDWVLTPVKDENGRVAGVILALIDRTEQKQAHLARAVAADELRRNEELLRRILENLPVGVWRVDRTGQVLQVNPEGVRIWGEFRPVDMAGYSQYTAWWPATGLRVQPQEWPVSQVLRSGAPCLDQELEIESFDGHRRIVSHSAVPLIHDDQLDGAVVVTIDLTARKRTQAQLEQTVRELRTMSRLEHEHRQLSEGLAQATMAVNASLALDEVLRLILEQVERVMPFQAGAIDLIEDGKVQTTYLYHFENHPELARQLRAGIVLEDYPLLRAIVEQQVMALVEDTRQDPRWTPMPGVDWVRSYVGLPLVAGERIIGVMNLLGDAPGFFRDDLCDRLTAFAASAAMAIHNARAYQAEHTARQQAEIMSEASLALTESLDMDVVLDHLLTYLARLAPFTAAQAALVEDESSFTVRAVRGGAPVAPVTLSGRVADFPHLAELLDGEKSLLIRDLRRFEGWQPLLGLSEAQSWLGVTLLVSGGAVGFISLEAEQPGAFTTEHQRLAEVLTGQAATAIQNAWLFEQVRTGSERLQSLSHRLVEVQESERRYIARELHDEASQALTSLTVMLQLIEKHADDPAYVTAKAGEMGLGLQKVLQNLHHLAMALRPATLDHLGLQAALNQYLSGVRDTHGLEVQFRTVGVCERMAPDVETSLYRVVQEAVTNVVRHAHATRVDVLVQTRRERLVIVIEDNGVGFDPASLREKGRLGVLGMQERVEMLDGVLTIESAPGKGTTLVVELPYDDSRNPCG